MRKLNTGIVITVSASLTLKYRRGKKSVLIFLFYFNESIAASLPQARSFLCVTVIIYTVSLILFCSFLFKRC